MRRHGLGLIEVMAALGILSAIVTSVMVANRSMIQDVGKITYAYEAQNVLRDIRSILADYNSCTFSLAGKNPEGGTVSAIKYKASLNDAGTTRYTTGQKIRSNAANITIESMTLTADGDTKLLDNETYLIIKFATGSNKLALAQEKILVNYVASGNQITNCYVASNKSHEYWARLATDPDTIYYFGRLQLGGLDESSTARLVIDQTTKSNPNATGKDPYTDGKGNYYCGAGLYWFDKNGNRKIDNSECYPVSSVFYGGVKAANASSDMDAVSKGQMDTKLSNVISYYASLPTTTPDAVGTACRTYFGHDPQNGEWMGDWSTATPEPECCQRCPGKACEDFFGHRMCIPRASTASSYIGSLADKTVVCSGNYFGSDLVACLDACVPKGAGGCDYDSMWQCKSKSVSLYCGLAGTRYRCYAWCGSSAPTPIPTPIPTNTPNPGATRTPTRTPNPTNSPTPTNTNTPTNTPTPTNSATPTITPYTTNTPIPNCVKTPDMILVGTSNANCSTGCCSKECFSDLIDTINNNNYYYCGNLKYGECSSGEGLTCDSVTVMGVQYGSAYLAREALATCRYQVYPARAQCFSRQVYASNYSVSGSDHSFTVKCGTYASLPSNVPSLKNGAICAVTNYMCSDADQFKYCKKACSNWPASGLPSPISPAGSFYQVYVCPGEKAECDNDQPGLLCNGVFAGIVTTQHVFGATVCRSRAMADGICFTSLADVPLCPLNAPVGGHPDGYYMGTSNTDCADLCASGKCFTDTAYNGSTSVGTGYYCGNAKPSSCDDSVPGNYCGYMPTTDARKCFYRYAFNGVCGLPDGWRISGSSQADRCRSRTYFTRSYNASTYYYCGNYMPGSCNDSIPGILCDETSSTGAQECFHLGVYSSKCVDPEATHKKMTQNAQHPDGYLMPSDGDCTIGCSSGRCYQVYAMTCPIGDNCYYRWEKHCGASRPNSCNDSIDGIYCNNTSAGGNNEGGHCWSGASWKGDNKCGLPNGHITGTSERCRAGSTFSKSLTGGGSITSCGSSKPGSCNDQIAGIICNGTTLSASYPSKALCHSGHMEVTDLTCRSSDYNPPGSGGGGGYVNPEPDLNATQNAQQTATANARTATANAQTATAQAGGGGLSPAEQTANAKTATASAKTATAKANKTATANAQTATANARYPDGHYLVSICIPSECSSEACFSENLPRIGEQSWCGSSKPSSPNSNIPGLIPDGEYAIGWGGIDSDNYYCSQYSADRYCFSRTSHVHGLSDFGMGVLGFEVYCGPSQGDPFATLKLNSGDLCSRTSGVGYDYCGSESERYYFCINACPSWPNPTPTPGRGGYYCP